MSRKKFKPEDFMTETNSTPIDIKSDDIFVTMEDKAITDNTTTIQDAVESLEKNMYTINIHLPSPAMQIEYEAQATGQKASIMAANQELRLMQGRFYFIPVNLNTVDTDILQNMKIFSDMAKLIDIRYIKNGFACVMPLRHNISLNHGQRLAVVW